MPPADSPSGAKVRIFVDGQALSVDSDGTLLAALWNAGVGVTRTSIRGDARGALCAMGICFECRVTIDGRAHQRACTAGVRDGLQVVTRG